MPVRTFALCALVLLLAWTAAAQPNAVDSVGQMVNQPVVSVRVVADGLEVRDPQVMSLLDVRVGERLSMAAVRRTIGRIMGLGIYVDVQVRGRLVDGGVSLDVALVAATEVQRITFVGSTELPEQTLRDRRDRPFRDETCGRARHGYRAHPRRAVPGPWVPAASVQPRPLDDQGSASGTLVFDIAARTRAIIRTLAFRGSPGRGRGARPRRSWACEKGRTTIPRHFATGSPLTSARCRDQGLSRGAGRPLRSGERDRASSLN